MYCSNCGFQVNDDLNFCTNCGKPLIKSGLSKEKSETSANMERATDVNVSITDDQKEPEKKIVQAERTQGTVRPDSSAVSFDQDPKSVSHYVLAVLCFLVIAFQGICLWLLPTVQGSLDLILVQYEGNAVSLYAFFSKLESLMLGPSFKGMALPIFMTGISVISLVVAFLELLGSSKKNLSYARNFSKCWEALVVGSFGMIISYGAVALWGISETPDLIKEHFAFLPLFYVSLAIAMLTFIVAVVMWKIFDVLRKEVRESDDYKRYLNGVEILRERAIKKNIFHPYSKGNWGVLLFHFLLIGGSIISLLLMFWKEGFLEKLSWSLEVCLGLDVFLLLLLIPTAMSIVFYKYYYFTEKYFLNFRSAGWFFGGIAGIIMIVEVSYILGLVGALPFLLILVFCLLPIIEILIIHKYKKRDRR